MHYVFYGSYGGQKVNSISLYNVNYFEYCRVSFKNDIQGKMEERSEYSEFGDWRLKFALASTKILDKKSVYV